MSQKVDMIQINRMIIVILVWEMTIAVNGEKWPDTNPNPLEIYIGGRNALPIAGATPTGYYLKNVLG